MVGTPCAYSVRELAVRADDSARQDYVNLREAEN